jgi:hypothetical protein
LVPRFEADRFGAGGADAGGDGDRWRADASADDGVVAASAAADVVPCAAAVADAPAAAEVVEAGWEAGPK